MDFFEENVQAAVTGIQEGMSRREADKVFGVPKTTLGQILKGPSNKPGQPLVLTVEGKKVTVDRIQVMGSWGSQWAQYKWPSHDNVDTCDFEDIVEVLPHPKMTRRGAVTYMMLDWDTLVDIFPSNSVYCCK